jgi:excisionase family DNA binding protein
MADVPPVTRHTPLAELPDPLRVEEVAAKLDCSAGVVYAMARSGELASVRLGRLLRIPRAALARLIEHGVADG